jgi:KDO2-lipid IV(A) lauroyltransferase
MQTPAIRFLLTLTAWLPLRVNHALAWALGRLMSVIPNDARRVTRINLQLCLPELDDGQRRELEKHSLIEMVKSGLELGPMWLSRQSRCLGLIRAVHGEDLLEQAMRDRRGVILMVPHIGMWELIGIYGSSRYPMTSLYRPARLAGLDSIMRHGRERCGATLVPTDARGIRALYQALSRGELIAILPDQEPRWGNGVFAPFFGHQAYTATLLPRMAGKSRATVLLTWAERLPRGRGFDLHFESVSADCHASDPVRAATAINAEVERLVRALPAQYQWHYRRFRTRPEGEARGLYGRRKKRR